MDNNYRNLSALVTNKVSAEHCIHGLMQAENLCESLRNAFICDCIIAAYPELHSDELLQECVGFAMQIDDKYGTNIISEFIPDKNEYLDSVEEDFANIYPTKSEIEFDDDEITHLLSL